MPRPIDPKRPPTSQMFVDPEVDSPKTGKQALAEQEPEKSFLEQVQAQKEAEVKQQLSREENVRLAPELGPILTLPSNGLMGYPSEVVYRDILVEDEEILATTTDATYSKVMNRVLKSILGDPDFYEEMSIHDRDFALIWVWANNYDPVKEVMIKCPSCGHKTTHRIDLTKLEVTPLKDTFEPVKTFQLKKTGKEIGVKMITVEDELFAEKYVKENPGISYNTILLFRSIILPQVMPFAKKADWIRKNLNSKDFGKVKAFHNHFRFGISPFMDYKCSNPECGEVTRDLIPFQAEDVYMPTLQSDSEEWLSASQSIPSESE